MLRLAFSYFGQCFLKYFGQPCSLSWFMRPPCSLSWFKIYLFCTFVNFFYHSKHTYQTHILYFLNIEKCCLNHDIKHIFFVLFTLKTRFSTILFKSQFSHLFKQRFLKTMTKRTLNFSKISSPSYIFGLKKMQLIYI